MRKQITIILFAFITISGFSQESDSKNFYLKGGSAYFLDIGSSWKDFEPHYSDMLEKFDPVIDGNSTWLTFGYKSEKGYISELYMMRGYSKEIIYDKAQLYTGKYFYKNQVYIAINFAKELKLGKSNCFITPSVGLAYLGSQKSGPDYMVEGTQDGIPIITMPEYFTQDESDMAITFSLESYYKFKNGLLLGVRAESNYGVTSTFRSLMLGPVIGVNF